jgi:allantoin racemase
MRILFINPNTSEGFTEKIQRVAEQYASPGTIVRAVNPTNGPRSIECIYDELLSAPGTLEILLANLESYDAFVIACYSDHPTIYAGREITDKPIMGIAEASMYFACMLGRSFSVVTTNREWEPLLWDAVRHYGLNQRCASIRSVDLPVLALEDSEEESFQLILKSSQEAKERDQAEVICLGCAGMAGLDKKLQAKINIPVVDGVVCALKLMEGLVGYGARTSKFLTYSQPGYKEVIGYSAIFNTPYRSKP